MSNKDVLVSVCVITFNQKAYIQQALDSILSQKTNFDYEILVHDDCSTDGTIEILKKYKEKYPDIIKLLLEEENQYSNGKKITPFFIPYIKGKYCVLNEGDDYWCDNLKLQKQYDFLENNSEYSMVCHNAKKINDKGDVVGNFGKNKDVDYSTEQTILGGGGFIATNSMMFRADLLKNLPRHYYECSIGDYILAIHFVMNGKVRYLSNIMSVYRVSTKGSWSKRYAEDEEFFNNFTNNMISTVEKMKNYYDNKYNKYFDIVIKNFKNTYKLRRYKFFELIKNDKELFKQLSFHKKISIFLNSYLSKFMKIYYKIKRSLNE